MNGGIRWSTRTATAIAIRHAREISVVLPWANVGRSVLARRRVRGRMAVLFTPSEGLRHTINRHRG
jgi:hypothetical protein